MKSEIRFPTSYFRFPISDMKNALELSYLVPLLPLIGFLVIGLGRKYLSKSLTGLIGSGVVLLTFLVSVWIFLQVKGGNNHVADYFNFISAGTLKIPFGMVKTRLRFRMAP